MLIGSKRKNEPAIDASVKFSAQNEQDALQCLTLLKNPSICHLRLPHQAIVFPFMDLVEIIKR